MIYKTLLIVTILYLSTQVLGNRDLEADINTADSLMNKTYANAESFQVNIAGFRKVLYSDIAPYANDIEVRMYSLGIEPVQIQELVALYQLYLAEIDPMLTQAISEIGYAYLFPTSKTSYDLNNNINTATLTEDRSILEVNNEKYKEDFADYVSEIDWRLTTLFVLNWELIRGTTGPDREAIDADREYIYNATTGYRDQLKVHMGTLDQDVLDSIEALDVVIAQLP